jgi:signal transduction histidine kinase
MDAGETILVVDDEDLLRMNIRAFLEDLGFVVVEASGGKEAFEIMKVVHPDLILLDFSMPGMNGIEVCARLKAAPATAEIPVLFLSALLDTADKISAFASGAVDYVTKPFQFEEVQARVQAHLELGRQRRQLRAQHQALRSLEELRDGFTHMVAHDMRGHLSRISASLELSQEELPEGHPGLSKKLGLARASVADLDEMITQMLELSRMESNAMPMQPCLCDLSHLAEAALDFFRPGIGTRKLRLSAPGPVMAWCDPGIISRVLTNLLGNAMKFVSAEGSVGVTVACSDAQARVTVTDDGPGIAEEFQKTVFQKFRQSPGGVRTHGVGLGLAFCKSAVEAHHGEIGVESRLHDGCSFWFTLPAGPQA